ncbi:MAG: hypothetical protein COX19_17160 [Desulfobacterales bacterium CG23_combo_of_CG06-09_8_20_14_all_51_8]|nr:MAG: hypothetical protein COX19_17160 [Desulfobacterales bacterium CG23_combo_of_CG06-09_8_20_14_all_51_8]
MTNQSRPVKPMIKIIKTQNGGVFFRTVIILFLILMAGLGGALFYGSKSIHDLFANNKKLQQAIANLTREDQIGYAKVIRQGTVDGRLYTTLKFVETARDNQLKTVLAREYTIPGDVVFFDALIVSFPDDAIMAGEKRALYLWRRVYGETMAPADGFPIEMESQAPKRYADFLHALSLPDQEMFWEAVWQLADDPDTLKKYGIRAVYGNAVYKKLRPGLIYVFKISANGRVYPETVPDI